jgi:hypothetical protein
MSEIDQREWTLHFVADPVPTEPNAIVSGPRILAEHPVVEVVPASQLQGAEEALRAIQQATGTSTEAWHIAARALEALGR